MIGDEDGFDVPSSTTARRNPDEVVLEKGIETVVSSPLAPREIKFFALDKWLAHRQFALAPFWLSERLMLLFPFLTGRRHLRKGRRAVR